MEGIGAINFFKLDDIAVSQLGEKIDSDSIIMLPMEKNLPVFPIFKRDINDGFIRRVTSSGKKWIIVVNEKNQPYMAFNANIFLREALFTEVIMTPERYCHKPIIVRDASTQLGKEITDLKVYAKHESDDVIEEDLILIWSEEKRVITGTDILGRLLRGIVVREAIAENQTLITSID